MLDTVGENAIYFDIILYRNSDGIIFLFTLGLKIYEIKENFHFLGHFGKRKFRFRSF